MPLDPAVDKRVPPSPDAGTDLSVSFTEFSITDEIGSGGSATVYRADVPDGPVDHVAVKQPDWESTITRDAIDSFLAEAEDWDRIDDHPHIASVFGSGPSPRPWLAMEYLDGGELADRLPVEDPLEALWIASAVADAVQHAHNRGVAHRDLTPSNILLASSDEEQWDQPKLVDWGLATVLGESEEPEGYTIGYAAPEQTAGAASGSVGPVADVYQLGAVTYALLVGTPPTQTTARGSGDGTHPVTPPSERRDDVPHEIDPIVLRALEPEPADRYRAAAQFGEACERCFESISEGRSSADRNDGTERTDASAHPDQAQSPTTDPSPSGHRSAETTAHDSATAEDVKEAKSRVNNAAAKLGRAPVFDTSDDGDDGTGEVAVEVGDRDQERTRDRSHDSTRDRSADSIAAGLHGLHTDSIAAAIRDLRETTGAKRTASIAEALRREPTRPTEDTIGDSLRAMHNKPSR
ncbi:protein kinase [Halobaculum sp. WSA2]|uniref:Protein kinase n=1 Tax=Halobaculum saliterrae TaxID=2073113 RepID=A0A6B0SVN7_9EURY|nr:serine/threonine-protein kinase [Halobaculum saliterrae]MXR40731.1 protein kinase [Halobaculum saliterrae]